MELVQTQTRTIHQLSAEKDGWSINASVTIVDDMVQNIDGYMHRDGVDNVNFNVYRNGTKLIRGIHNVTEDAEGVCVIMETFVSATKAKYESFNE